MIGENFQIYNVKITGKCIREIPTLLAWFDHLCLMPPVKQTPLYKFAQKQWKSFLERGTSYLRGRPLLRYKSK